MKDNQEKITFEEALQRVQEDGRQLASLNPEFQNNFDIVLAAVQQNGWWALRHASERLKNDPEVVLAAVKQNGIALFYAGKDLEKDPRYPEIVMAAVKQNGLALEFASERLKDDPEIVMAAVKKNVAALEFASERLKDDPEIVMAAVKKNGVAIFCASRRLQDNPDIVLAAVKQNGRAYHFISDAKLKNDIRYVLNLASTKEIKNLQEKLTGNLQVLTVEQAEKFMQEPGNSLEY